MYVYWILFITALLATTTVVQAYLRVNTPAWQSKATGNVVYPPFE